jgi:hypothetical protein
VNTVEVVRGGADRGEVPETQGLRFPEPRLQRLVALQADRQRAVPQLNT